MKKNLEKLVALRDILVQRPEQHNQGTWCSDVEVNPLDDCGTSACAAGWALALEGIKVQDIYEAQRKAYESDEPIYPCVSDTAAEILGLTYLEGDALFLGTLDEDDAEKAAIALLDEYIDAAKRERERGSQS